MGKASYENELKEAQKAMIKYLYPDAESLKKAAKELGMDYERVRHARDYGKGSTVTINGLILLGFGVHPSKIQSYLPKIRKVIQKPSELSVIEQMFEDLRSRFSDQDIIAWFRLLIARDEIERELGIRKGVGRPKKT